MRNSSHLDSLGKSGTTFFKPIPTAQQISEEFLGFFGSSVLFTLNYF
jgi:hypothetical protein